MAEREQREWRDDELRAACEAYLAMLAAERNGQPLVKKQVYRDLASRFEPSEKSFERRMQNISAVLMWMDHDWIDGLKPLKNVGKNVIGKIQQMIDELEDTHTLPVAVFESEVNKRRTKPQRHAPAGNRQPRTSDHLVTTVERDPAVKAWVLQQANGHCECCGQAAPFTGNDGLPYLEVHHVVRLADNGPDTIDNAVAICPNCHRALHYAHNHADLVSGLYRRIARLKPVTLATN